MNEELKNYTGTPSNLSDSDLYIKTEDHEGDCMCGYCEESYRRRIF